MSKLRKSVPLYEDIRALVLSARQTIARGVDLLQVHTNYEIGHRIFEQEQHGADRAEYGKELLNELAVRLTAEFGAGFSRTNLASMRQFYVAYPDRVSRIVQTPSGQFKGRAIRQTLSGELPVSPIVQTLSGQSLDPGTQPQPAFTLSWSSWAKQSPIICSASGQLRQVEGELDGVTRKIDVVRNVRRRQHQVGG